MLRILVRMAPEKNSNAANMSQDKPVGFPLGHGEVTSFSALKVLREDPGRIH